MQGRDSADYAIQILNGVRLYRPLRMNKAALDKQRNLDIGAQLFAGNLDPLVDDKVLCDTFSVFCRLIGQPKIARDPDGVSRGFGFVSYDNFDSSAQALEAMNNQYLMNKPCQINYAFKRDGKGERHGDEAERLHAAQAKKNNYIWLALLLHNCRLAQLMEVPSSLFLLVQLVLKFPLDRQSHLLRVQEIEVRLLDLPL
jgi:RNA recognition motif-containing protein